MNGLMSMFGVVPTDTLLTTAEVAERIRKSQRTVARWADAGRLPIAALAGDVRLFRPADVETLAAELATEAEAHAAHLRGVVS